eukprot:COSAG04_NODE_4059_length_2331_cov_1.996864_1_plen_186_part_10
MPYIEPWSAFHGSVYDIIYLMLRHTEATQLRRASRDHTSIARIAVCGGGEGGRPPRPRREALGCDAVESKLAIAWVDVAEGLSTWLGLAVALRLAAGGDTGRRDPLLRVAVGYCARFDMSSRRGVDARSDSFGGDTGRRDLVAVLDGPVACWPRGGVRERCAEIEGPSVSSESVPSSTRSPRGLFP